MRLTNDKEKGIFNIHCKCHGFSQHQMANLFVFPQFSHFEERHHCANNNNMGSFRKILKQVVEKLGHPVKLLLPTPAYNT